MFNVTPSDKYPFVVKLKTPDNQDLYSDTGIIFEEVSNAHFDKWNAVTLNRRYDPLAFVALLYSQWDKIKPKIADVIGLSPSCEKLESLENFLTKETPYRRAEESAQYYDAIPIKICMLRRSQDKPELTFQIRLPEQLRGEKIYELVQLPSFTLQQMYQGLIEHQYHLLNKLVILGQPENQIPLHAKIASWLKEARLDWCSESALRSSEERIVAGKKKSAALWRPEDTLREQEMALQEGDRTVLLRNLFKKNKNIPQFYKDLWLSLADESQMPDILRLKMLVGFYDKILKNGISDLEQTDPTASKHFVTEEEQKDLEKNFFENARAELARVLPQEFPLIPDKLTRDLITEVKPDYLGYGIKHAANSVSGAIEAVSNATGNAVAYARSKKQIHDFLNELYELLIKDQERALPLYVFIKALIRAVLAATPEDGVQSGFLNEYADTLHFAMSKFEKVMEDNRRVSTKTSVPGKNIELTKSACMKTDTLQEQEPDLIQLKQSPYAWYPLLNRYKFLVSFQNFTLGYPIFMEKGFKVSKINRGPEGNYEITYALSEIKTGTFLIKGSEGLERFLKDKTKESYRIPLLKRAQGPIKKDANFNAIFSESLHVYWQEDPRLTELKKRLEKSLSLKSPETDYILSENEKIRLFVYSLINAALEDDSPSKGFMGKVAEILRLITLTSFDCNLISPNELFDAIEAIDKQNPNLPEVCRRKAMLCEILDQIETLPFDMKRFKSQEELEKYLSPPPKDNKYSESSERVLILEQGKFIRETEFKKEYGLYPNDDLKAIHAIHFYLKACAPGLTAPCQQLFRKISDLLILEKDLAFWSGGILFHAISQWGLMALDLDNLPFALTTLSHQLLSEFEGKFTKKNFLDQEKKELLDLLEKMEMASLKSDVIPEFFGLKKEKHHVRQRVVAIESSNSDSPKTQPKAEKKEPAHPQGDKRQMSYEQINLEYIQELREKYAEPENKSGKMPKLYETYTEITNRYDAAIKRLDFFVKKLKLPDEADKPLTQNSELADEEDKPFTKEELNAKLVHCNEHYKKVRAEKVRIAKDYSELFSMLNDVNRKLNNEKLLREDKEAQHIVKKIECLYMDDPLDKTEMSEEFRAIKNVDPRPLIGMLKKLSDVAETLEKNFKTVWASYADAKSQRGANEAHAFGRVSGLLKTEAGKMIDGLKELEAQLQSESLRESTKTCAKINAYGLYNKEDDKLNELEGKFLPQAKLLQATSQLRVVLSTFLPVKPEVQPKAAGLATDYHQLGEDIRELEAQYENASWLTSPLTKYSLKKDIANLKKEKFLYERPETVITPWTEYERTSWTKPLTKIKALWSALWGNKTELNPPVLKEDSSLRSNFASCCLDQEGESSRKDELLWTAKKLREQGLTQYLSTVPKDPMKAVAHCDTVIAAFNKALEECKHDTRYELSTYLTKYAEAKKWTNPMIQFKNECLDRLFAEGDSQSTGAGNTMIFSGFAQTPPSESQNIRTGIYDTYTSSSSSALSGIIN